jgi:Rrf2 family protein
MRSSSRFTVALHVLTLLAYERDRPLTSEYVAGSVNTNPVVIRRILADLRRAKLVGSRGGGGGGWSLLRAPAAITLRDVYRAVEGPALFPLHPQQPNPRCPVGHDIQRVLAEQYELANQALEARLAATTIADLRAGIDPASPASA